MEAIKLAGLEPKAALGYFEKLCTIPHGSGNTKMISDYLVSYAKEHGLRCIQDELNNVILFGDGTCGMEDHDPVILQGHMDMVCDKDPDCTLDMTKEGLDVTHDGEYIFARGTTLGGDDGIAVAYALALLEDKSIPHPPLEVIITVDEEIGMPGAKDIDVSMLKGRTMINLDSEVEGAFTVACAGAATATLRMEAPRTAPGGETICLTVDGLQGGHSGGEIHKNRGNANKIMGRLLARIQAAAPLRLVSIAGGVADNVIPRSCQAGAAGSGKTRPRAPRDFVTFLISQRKHCPLRADRQINSGDIVPWIVGHGGAHQILLQRGAGQNQILTVGILSHGMIERLHTVVRADEGAGYGIKTLQNAAGFTVAAVFDLHQNFQIAAGILRPLAELLQIAGMENRHIGADGGVFMVGNDLHQLRPAGDKQLLYIEKTVVAGVDHRPGVKVNDLKLGLLRRSLQNDPPPHHPQQDIQSLVVLCLQPRNLCLQITAMLFQLLFKGTQIPVDKETADGFYREGQIPQLLKQEDGLNLILCVKPVVGYLIPVGRDENSVLVVIPKQLGGDMAQLGHLPDGVHCVAFQIRKNSFLRRQKQ